MLRYIEIWHTIKSIKVYKLTILYANAILTDQVASKCVHVLLNSKALINMLIGICQWYIWRFNKICVIFVRVKKFRV
jgi:hypothetical protein